MEALKCSISVTAGIILGAAMSQFSRVWDFTQEDLDNPPTYIDKTGAAMNYAMSLQNPSKVNWARLEWIWY